MTNSNVELCSDIVCTHFIQQIPKEVAERKKSKRWHTTSSADKASKTIASSACMSKCPWVRYRTNFQNQLQIKSVHIETYNFCSDPAASLTLSIPPSTIRLVTCQACHPCITYTDSITTFRFPSL